MVQLGALAFCVHLLFTPASSQCVSNQRNDSASDAVFGPRARGNGSIIHRQAFEISSRGGCRVEVYLCNGSVIYGDLLTVGDSMVSVFAYRDFSYSPSQLVNSGIHEFSLRGIRKLVLKGRTNILQGVFIGFVGGMLAGSVMTRIVDQHTSAGHFLGPGGLGGLGIVVGGSIGYFSSATDLEISKFDIKDLNVLKSLSRDSTDRSR